MEVLDRKLDQGEDWRPTTDPSELTRNSETTVTCQVSHVTEWLVG